MMRLTKDMRRSIVQQFESGASLALIAERLHLGIWQVEAVIREVFVRMRGLTP